MRSGSSAVSTSSTWIPFGGGHTRCPGDRIALVELKATLTEILTTCDVRRRTRRRRAGVRAQPHGRQHSEERCPHGVPPAQGESRDGRGLRRACRAAGHRLRGPAGDSPAAGGHPLDRLVPSHAPAGGATRRCGTVPRDMETE
ncbi:cytochrome P450 [Streptomyces sp. NPDC044984]|uniref:cytochrome P450 n=1 Tax=Streptomyces sp. NPDC044984 TaxID=3154335 RepID=UPI0034060EE6